MKRISGNVLVAVALIVACNPCFSKRSHVIPNAESALNYHGKSKGEVYIRLGSFSHESNAQKYREFLKNKTRVPVTLNHRQQYYTVDVGPLRNATEIRKVAANFLAMPNQAAKQPKHTPKLLTQLAAAETVASPISIMSASNTEPPAPAKTVSNIEPPVPAKAVSNTEPLKPDVINKKTKSETNLFFTKSRSLTNWFSHTNSPGVFLSAGVGEQFFRVSGNNSLNTGAGWPLDRYVTDSISNQPYFILAGGYTFARLTDWLPYYSFGLMYTYVKAATIAGYIDQYSSPAFRNYNFQYDIQLMNVLATLKADIYRWHNVMPYLLIGLGATNYSATNYNEQALGGVTPRVNPAFGSNAGTNFSASFGAGIDYILRENVWLNAEFNYTNYGKITTGKGVNYSTDTSVNYSDGSLGNSIFATSLLVGVTYYTA